MVKNFKILESTLWSFLGDMNELSDVQMVCCAKVFWKPCTEDTLPLWLLSTVTSSAATVARCLQPTVVLDGMVLDLLSKGIRGAFKSNFWKNLGIWPNQVDPPPLPQSWDPQN